MPHLVFQSIKELDSEVESGFLYVGMSFKTSVMYKQKLLKFQVVG
jgi:hypothetical protein